MELLLLLLVPFAFVGASGGGGDEEETPRPSENEVTEGTSGAETISGSTGEDMIFGAGGSDNLQGGTGRDALVGEAGDDSLKGGFGRDVLIGGAGDDAMGGGGSRDVLFGMSGADEIYGGDGDDALVGLDPRAGLTAAEITGPLQGALSDALDARFGDDITQGQIDRALGGVVSADGDISGDLLNGGAGDDVLLGDNADTLTGGDGDDAFGVEWVVDREQVRISDFDPTTESLEIHMERAPTGPLEFFLNERSDGSGTEVLIGGQQVAFLVGVTAAEADAAMITLKIDRSDVELEPSLIPDIVGTKGDDSLTGTSFGEVLEGLAGSDSLFGGEGGEDSLFGGGGNDLLVGADDNDLLEGSAGFDSIIGNFGDDQAFGGSGGDTLRGGWGNDTLDGGDDRDLIDGRDNHQPGGFDTDPDPLTAGDTLIGGEGDDTLYGDMNDIMTGGAGVDTFHGFGDADEGVITVADFDPTDEMLLLLDPAATGAPATNPSAITFVQAGADIRVLVLGEQVALLKSVLVADLKPGSVVFGA